MNFRDWQSILVVDPFRNPIHAFPAMLCFQSIFQYVTWSMLKSKILEVRSWRLIVIHEPLILVFDYKIILGYTCKHKERTLIYGLWLKGAHPFIRISTVLYIELIHLMLLNHLLFYVRMTQANSCDYFGNPKYRRSRFLRL